MTGLTIENLTVGAVAEVTHTVTRETVREFILASGDDNPIHSDETFAAATRFGRVIAPGMLTASFVSAVIGTQLPGPGTIYLSQSLRFLKPVYIGDRVTARVEVVERMAERNRIRLRTTCANPAGELILEGEAWVLPATTRIEYRPAAPARPASTPLALLPGALAAELMTIWMSNGLALASQALALAHPAPARRAAEADPIRP